MSKKDGLMPSSSIVNVDLDVKPLSDTANLLIEKISGAIGGIAAPKQIIRMAKAEVDAAKMKSKAGIEIQQLEQRALNRFVLEEAKKQNNIENIAKQAIPMLAADSKPQEIEDDWITNFFDKCRIVSDKQMQGLWARVLSGEANSPGKFSKRTVNFLGSLDKTEATLFTSLCGFSWVIETAAPIVFDPEAKIYKENNINFSALKHLDSIGLISFESVAGYVMNQLPKRLTIGYFGRLISIVFPMETENTLDVGKVMLTGIGKELSTICNSEPINGFYEYAKDKWVASGFVLSEVLPNKKGELVK